MGNSELERLLRTRRVSRRGFLFIAGAGSAAFLAACAGQAVSPTSAPPTSAPVVPTNAPAATTAAPTTAPAATTAATSAPAATTASANLESDLFLYNWADYVDPDNLTAFSKAKNVKVTTDFYESNEDLLAKVEAGGTGYDIAAPTAYTVKIMADKGLLLPLDMSKIPNFKYMAPNFAKGRPNDPDSKWSVTKDWGTTGISWNSEKVTEQITSMDDLFKLAPKYSGKIAAMDSAPEAIGMTLKYLGYSYNSCNQKELDAALQKLLELKPHIKAFDSSYFDLLATDEVWISLAWNGDVFNANGKRVDAGKKPSLQYVIPKEGGEIWEDTWVILKSAPHPNAAHAFINFILDPQVQAKESNYTHYASGEDEAKKYMDPEVANNPSVYPAAEQLMNVEAAQALDGDCLKARDDLWTKLKSA